MKRTIGNILEQADLELAQIRSFYWDCGNPTQAESVKTLQDKLKLIMTELDECGLTEEVVSFADRPQFQLKLMCLETDRCLRSVKAGVESQRTAENASAVGATLNKLDHVIHEVNDRRPKD